MRSRGDTGYREFFHTGSERQRLDVVEVLGDDGQRAFTLSPGAWPEMPEFLERVALPALRGRDPEPVAFLRRAVREPADSATVGRARQARGGINPLGVG